MIKNRGERMQAEIDAIALRKAQLQTKKKELTEGLPHLYGWPWYTWARKFFESRNKLCVITAANQISKSSTLIRKHIHRATDVKSWPELWKHRPQQFWYLYPTRDVSTIEFEKKWIPEFMPRGKFKTDPQYGWKAEYNGRFIHAIHWNSGVSSYFKHYSQNATDLQTGTVSQLDCDEELPIELFDELMLRLAATDGYADFVFTATLNQDFWRRAMECQGTAEETLKGAFKQQISMYDCLKYEDGSRSTWTVDRIKQVEARCSSQTEIDRRVHGRFVTEEGRKYPAFDPTRHFIQPMPIPEDWKYYAAVDIGSGGQTGHPAAMIFIAVRPDFRLGYICRGWRGDGVLTTSGDILDKYREIRGGLQMSLQIYDGQARDFGTIAARVGEPFIRAEKSHAIGEDVLNTLFKNDMLFVFDTDELRKLGTEMTNLMKLTTKNHAKDDFCDATRYTVVHVPWDWTCLSGALTDEQIEERRKTPLTEQELKDREIKDRRGVYVREEEPEGWQELAEEFEFWNEQCGS